MMTTYTKGPAETLDYSVDWDDWLSPTDTILTSSWTVTPSGLTVVADTNEAREAEIIVSGGTLDETYTLVNTITTTEGLGSSREFDLLVAIPLPPCWPIDPGCFTEEWEAYEPDVKERSFALATATLRRLTAYRVSDCPITARPAPTGRSCALGAAGFIPSNFGGTWTNTPMRGSLKDLELPPPVSRIEEVKIDGVAQDLDDFEVYNRHILTYVGADEDWAWPQTQDFTKPDTEEGTFSVTYLNAHPVDSNGAYAAGLLAVEFGKACSGDKKCRLPGTVTQIVRQGLSIDIIGGSFPDGLTGIREVDSYVAQWNKGGRTAPTLFDPGAPRHRIQTSR